MDTKTRHRAPEKTKRGGQSAVDFSRLQTDREHKYILLDVLKCNTAVYLNELCRKWIKSIKDEVTVNLGTHLRHGDPSLKFKFLRVGDFGALLA